MSKRKEPSAGEAKPSAGAAMLRDLMEVAKAEQELRDDFPELCARHGGARAICLRLGMMRTPIGWRLDFTSDAGMRIWEEIAAREQAQHRGNQGTGPAQPTSDPD